MVNKISALVIASALAVPAWTLPLPAMAQEAGQDSGFSATQEDEIRAIVRDYLLKNPDVLVESLQIYQEQQLQAQREQQRQAIAALKETLERDPDSPVIGNPDGDVVLVEFFDYNCPYCKRVADDVRTLVEEDGNIRLVMKELPILGPQSRYAAQAALAAVKQDKYDELHFALMDQEGRLDQLRILQIAQDLGLDIDQLQKDMRDPEINAALRRTYQVAQSLQINGTPAFIVGDQLLPGALSAEELKAVIDQQRANSS